MHCIDALGLPTPTWTLLLQPTSPLRTAADIDAARGLVDERGVDAVLGVTLVRQHAAWHKRVDDEGHVVSLFDAPPTRQALPISWVPNGAIYLCRTSTLLQQKMLTPKKTAPLVMPGSRSIDVDVADDLVIAGALLREMA
jgi:CMP-N-acetylneuraminic acid synthetase